MAATLVFLICLFLVVVNFYPYLTDSIESYDQIAEANDIILHTLAYVLACFGITVLLMISGILIVLGLCFVFDVSHLTLLNGVQWVRGLRF